MRRIDFGKVKPTKRKFAVMITERIYNDWTPEYVDESDEGTYETFAVSEEQAVNNVRHRLFGDCGTSQYKPVSVSGYEDVWLDYEAREVI